MAKIGFDNPSRRGGPSGPLTRLLLALAFMTTGGTSAALRPDAGPATVPLAVGQQEFDEREVKAAMMVRFLDYVDYPEAQLPKDAKSLVIAILGTDPFGKKLDKLCIDGKAKGKSLVVRRYKDLAEATDLGAVHVVFLSSSLDKEMPKAIKSLEGKPVLTIGDTAKFVDAGGMIGLVLADKKVKFEVNNGAAKKAALSISSKLLKMALRTIG